MTLPPQIILYGFYASLFLATLFLIHGAAQFHAARRQAAETRLRRMGKGAVSGLGAPAVASLRRVYTSHGQDRDLRGWVVAWLSRRLRQADLSWQPRAVVYCSAGLAAACGILGTVAVQAIGAGPWSWMGVAAVLALAIASGVGLPLVVLAHLRARQLREFEARLPEALDVLVRALRAGHPISSAMAMVRSDLNGPVAMEIGRAVDEMTYGLELRQALGNMATRVEHPDLRFVIASVSLQHETGGNLAEILQGLADLMRARLQMAHKVRAHTAEARLSAKFLAIIPLVFVALVVTANPQVYGEAAKDPVFLPVLLSAGVLQVIGILIMRRMAHFRV